MASLRSVLLLAQLLPELVSATPITAQVLPRAITPACGPSITTNCVTATAVNVVKTGTINGKLTTQTFVPTTLTDFATVTTQTTVTTTDNTGATVVAVIGAAGAAYLIYVGALAAGAPAAILEPPALPTITPNPKPSPSPKPVSSSTTEEDTMTIIGKAATYTNNIAAVPTLITVPRDIKSCNKAGEKDPSFDLGFAQTSIKDFCKANANKDVATGAVDDIWSLGAGKQLNITISAPPLGCDATRISEKACNYYLGEALNGCDTKSNTIKHGGTVDNACLRYSMTAQTSDGQLRCTPNDLPMLPGLPGASTNTITYDKQTGMDRDEAFRNIDAFCSAMLGDDPKGRDIKPADFKNARIYYNPSKGNTQMNVSLTYNEQVDCPQTGDKAVYHTDKGSCVRLLRTVIDGCNTKFQPPYGKFGGIITDGCGVFGIQTAGVEPIACESSGTSMPLDVVNKAVDQFCNRGYNMNPDKIRDPNGFYQSPPDGSAWDSYVSGGYRVATQLEWNSLPQNTGCQVKKSKFDVKGDECRRRLLTVAGKCGTGGTMGAQQQEGCVTWQMRYQKL